MEFVTEFLHLQKKGIEIFLLVEAVVIGWVSVSKADIFQYFKSLNITAIRVGNSYEVIKLIKNLLLLWSILFFLFFFFFPILGKSHLWQEIWIKRQLMNSPLIFFFFPYSLEALSLVRMFFISILLRGTFDFSNTCNTMNKVFC